MTSSLITQYRADFFQAGDSLEFSVDTHPENDVDADPAPFIMHAVILNDDGVEVVRWVRAELVPYIGDAVVSPDPVTQDAICVFVLSAAGDTLAPPIPAGIARVEAFAVNNRGGVKQGCLFDVDGGGFDHEVIVLPMTPNYVLERLTYNLNTHIQLFDTLDKHKGKRKRLAP